MYRDVRRAQLMPQEVVEPVVKQKCLDCGRELKYREQERCKRCNYYYRPADREPFGACNPKKTKYVADVITLVNAMDGLEDTLDKCTTNRNGCWIWEGPFRWWQQMAQRIFNQFGGAGKFKMTCTTKGCLNPAHMETNQ